MNIIKVLTILIIIFINSILTINCIQAELVAEEIHAQKTEKKNVKVIKKTIVTKREYILIALSAYEKTKALIFKLSSITKNTVENALTIQFKIWKEELSKIESRYKKNNYKDVLLLSIKLRTTIINYLQSEKKIKKDKINIKKYEVTLDELSYGEVNL